MVNCLTIKIRLELFFNYFTCLLTIYYYGACNYFYFIYTVVTKFCNYYSKLYSKNKLRYNIKSYALSEFCNGCDSNSNMT